jgi:hypothetical protein
MPAKNTMTEETPGAMGAAKSRTQVRRRPSQARPFQASKAAKVKPPNASGAR